MLYTLICILLTLLIIAGMIGLVTLAVMLVVFLREIIRYWRSEK